jgi:hypothetical protein
MLHSDLELENFQDCTQKQVFQGVTACLNAEGERTEKIFVQSWNPPAKDVPYSNPPRIPSDQFLAL